jgi:hypothetical protein
MQKCELRQLNTTPNDSLYIENWDIYEQTKEHIFVYIPLNFCVHTTFLPKQGVCVTLCGLAITYSKGCRGRFLWSFPFIHPSHHPSMDGIVQGRKPWQKWITHVSLSRKGMPSPSGRGDPQDFDINMSNNSTYICCLQSFPMVSCMLLSHRSQAVQTSRFSAARVPMDTCEML